MAKITSLVGDAGPAEALYMEDGVGNTPLDTATQLWIVAARSYTQVNVNVSTLSEETWPYAQEVVEVSVEDAKSLKDTVESLRKQGRLRKGTKLFKALSAFADKVEVKAKERATLSPRVDEEQADKPKMQDDLNAGSVLNYLLTALATRPGRRILVHLDDVHRSVNGSLTLSINAGQAQERDDGGLGVEVVEDEETKAQDASIIQRFSDSAYPIGPFAKDEM